MQVNLSTPVSEKRIQSLSPACIKNSQHSVEHNDAQRFSHLLSVMPAAVVVLDKLGCISLANQQAISLLGEPLLGQAWRDVIARVFAPKADDGHEVSMRNGKRVKVDISALTEEKGQLIVITDLTETRELQSRVSHMQRLSSLGKMVASLAHQVRTPLSSALLYAENLKAMPLNNEVALKFSNKLTMRLKDLEAQVNDMLLFAKSSDEQIVNQLTPYNIQQKALGQIEAQLKQANIKFTLDDKLPKSAVTILGNLSAISGALSNLIANAMQALQEQNFANCEQAKFDTSLHNENNIVLSMKIENFAHQAYCVFCVKDNGSGIEKDKVNQLFEPFYTTKSQGTGLGLAVVNTVAKSHKGFVKCGNNAEKGAFFSLYLPIETTSVLEESKEVATAISLEVSNL